MRFWLPLFLVLISCGGSDSKKKSSGSGTGSAPSVPTVTPEPVEPEVISGFTDQGKFSMSFTSVNPELFNYRGSGSLNLDEKSFSVNTKATKAPFLRTVYQNLYQGNCPVINDDSNGDGIIDIQEAREVLGTHLMALDSNLENPGSNLDKFPRTNLFGNFSYSSSGRVEKILDQFKPGTRIDPAGLVVLTQGLPSFIRLPASVRSESGMSASETVPVSCATLSATP